MHVPLSVSGLRSRPRPQWLNQWNCSQVTQSSPRLCCIVLCPHRQGGKGDASLWSPCRFLRDAGAAAVQLAWPGTWLAGGSFSQMPAAFQSGEKRNSFLRHTMASASRKKMPLWSDSATLMNDSRLFCSLCITSDAYKSFT